MARWTTSRMALVGLIAAAMASAADAQTATPGSHSAFPALGNVGGNWGVLNEYCAKCHNFSDWAGGIAFDVQTPETVPDNRELWENTIARLRGGLMPPAGNPRPEQQRIDSFVSWMESYLDQIAAADPEPGRVALHRLNRKEYANAVRDILDVEIDPATILPQDDVSDGFDNVASVLQVSPSFLDQYLSAARTVALKAIGDPAPEPASVSYTADGTINQQLHIDGLPLGTRGGMLVEHNFPADGEYEINIGDLAVALWVFNLEFRNTLIVTLDGDRIFETTIGGEDDIKAIDQRQDAAVDEINARLKGVRFHATAGVHKVAVTFLERSFAESDARLEPLVPGGGQDRILRLGSFEIQGPFTPTGVSLTDSRKQIFICYPQQKAEEPACASRIISSLAERAFRRPVTEADLHYFHDFYQTGQQDGGFETGIRRALTGILASPYFLYRAETPPQTVTTGESFAISDIELASRLSFFLWSSVPDAELLELAEAGKLQDRTVLEQQVRRMLADPRSKSLVSNFAYQWLGLAKLDEVTPDPRIYPYASGAGDPRADFVTEIELFVGSIFRQNGSILDLMTADYTYLNERLALLYGIDDVKGDRFRRVTLKDSTRWGLLGKGGVLMASSYPNRTAPVLRGQWILENITGTPPAPPPPSIQPLTENVAGQKALSVRERLELHRADSSCNSCHGVLDPLGFALENFDAVGRWRDIDRFSLTRIDTSGVLPTGDDVGGPDDLREALMRRPDQFVQTLTWKLMTFALGRTVEYYDMPTVRAIVKNVAKQNYRFSALVMDIIESDQFQRRAVGDTASTREAALHE